MGSEEGALRITLPPATKSQDFSEPCPRGETGAAEACVLLLVRLTAWDLLQREPGCAGDMSILFWQKPRPLQV